MADSNVAMMCGDYQLEQAPGEESEADTQFEYISALLRQIPATDNIVFHFRPLNCKYIDTFFIALSQFGSQEQFDELCVDLDGGDPKPQIRFANVYTTFNITNYMSFEDIEFTGEDLFARVEGDHGETYDGGWEDLDQGILAFIPMRKCEVRKEPTQFFSKLDLRTVNAGRLSGLTPTTPHRLECDDGWNATAQRPPGEVDDRCFPGGDEVDSGTLFCGGEPYDENFFVSDGSVYYKRHKVIFNLYAFDAMRSNRQHAPTLVLERCDFKYFMQN